MWNGIKGIGKGIGNFIGGIFGGGKKKGKSRGTGGFQNTYAGAGGPGATVPIPVPRVPLTGQDYSDMYGGGTMPTGAGGARMKQEISVYLDGGVIARSVLVNLPDQAKLSGLEV